MGGSPTGEKELRVRRCGSATPLRRLLNAALPLKRRQRPPSRGGKADGAAAQTACRVFAGVLFCRES
ncbi:hypothetical protein cyc_03152 [Cyclospora cayetanensis]|uniref:Uncharacterized protein n=1 Tax=Cyclospora cayetanensis TaxID=88456 RepID=A0A1D3DAG8_9EIME|nr:hypothetical protein cyc_03152 [Cyclospora cayetanensis]